MLNRFTATVNVPKIYIMSRDSFYRVVEIEWRLQLRTESLLPCLFAFKRALEEKRWQSPPAFC